MENLAKEFIGLDNKTYFYTGAECPSLKSNEVAVRQYVNDKSLGEKGREKLYVVEEKLKNNLAKILNCKEAELSFAGNASEVMNNILDSLDIPSGSNIVINDLEYPSVVFPLLNLQSKGVEIRLIESRQGEVPLADYEKVIDENTYLVAVSHVSYVNGFKHDLKKLNILTKRKGALLLVDATQSLGVTNVDSEYCDFIIASSYKWLLGAHGVGVCYISEEMIQNLKPRRVGWRSVKEIFHKERFTEYDFAEKATQLELGYNSYPTIYILENSTRFLLRVGIDEIQNKVGQLGDYLIEKLESYGFEVITPKNQADRAGNIALKARDGAGVMTELLKRNVHIWGGDGRVRVSINFYNTEDEIDKLMTELISVKEELIDE